MLKTKNGITLIALIITIVVLLILTGVTINMVLGENGLINKSKTAVGKYENAADEEQRMMNAVLSETEKYLSGTSRETSTITVKEVKSGDKTVKVPIPDGFFYVGGDIDTGVIISDKKADENKATDWTLADDANGLKAHNVAAELVGNQFVWIPCTIDEYKKIDTFKTDTNATTWGYNAWNSRWDKYTNSAEEIQIKKYGGFYIGRYEAGVGEIFAEGAGLRGAVTVSTNSYGWEWQNTLATYNNITRGKKIVEIANEIPYYHADYNTALKLSKEMYDTDSVYSGLVTGTMWDMVMKYISSTSDYSDLKSTSWGNYYNTALSGIRGKISEVTTAGATGTWTAQDGTGTTQNTTSKYYLLTTGSTNQVQKKHIYDLAGNLWEWTDEAAYFDVGSSYTTNTDFNGYLLRGGSFSNSDSAHPATFRGCRNAAHTYTTYGFRPALFLK